MSYHTWHNYGYGICVSKIEVTSTESLEALLSHAPKYGEGIHEWFKDCEITEPTVDDYMDFDQYYYLGLATILKEVIMEAEGVELLACEDFDCETYLIFQPLYPWQMTDADLTLTEDRLDQLFQKYVSVLTDRAIVSEYQSVGNGG